MEKCERLTEHSDQQRAATYMHDPPIQKPAVQQEDPHAPPYDEVAQDNLPNRSHDDGKNVRLRGRPEKRSQGDMGVRLVSA